MKLYGSRLQQFDRTAPAGCAPPSTLPPNKTPRFKIPAGTRLQVRHVTSADLWRDHTTRIDLPFERFERYAAAFQHYEFRFKAWIIRVHRSKVRHREDLYKAGLGKDRKEPTVSKPRTQQQQPPTWKRCGNNRCGKMLKIPADPHGRCCPRCGETLTRAREP